MQTAKQTEIKNIAERLAPLGLAGNDAYRVAQQINQGYQGRSVQTYILDLHRACQETSVGGLDLLLRNGGQEDILIYGPEGYAIISFGQLDYVFAYSRGQSFASMTKIHFAA